MPHTLGCRGVSRGRHKMIKRRLLVASTILLALGGCTSPAVGTLAEKSSGSSPSASPSPTGPEPKEELVAALHKTHAGAYKFSVNADLPDKAHVKSSGAFDPK